MSTMRRKRRNGKRAVPPEDLAKLGQSHRNVKLDQMFLRGCQLKLTRSVRQGPGRTLNGEIANYTAGCSVFLCTRTKLLGLENMRKINHNESAIFVFAVNILWFLVVFLLI